MVKVARYGDFAYYQENWILDSPYKNKTGQIFGELTYFMRK